MKKDKKNKTFLQIRDEKGGKYENQNILKYYFIYFFNFSNFESV